MLKKIVIALCWLVILALVIVLILAPSKLDSSLNRVTDHDPYPVSAAATLLHQNLVVGDWHADSLLWNRDLAKENDYGHVDIPRLQKGNVGLQMFTTVTKSPRGLNYKHNETDAWDDVTSLAAVQRWPLKTWRSLKARALYQANKLYELVAENSDDVMHIENKEDILEWQKARVSNPDLIGVLLGTEGSHALEGELGNVEVLFDFGFRMMSLHHFFDNKLGGSLHGADQQGLTDFGKEVVARIQELSIVLDVAHSSEKVVEDILSIRPWPMVVSHTGFKGHCDTPRNISDELMKKIAQAGGLIAVGYWDAAVCDEHPKSIAAAIIYGIELVGEDHVALGSDFDGTVTTSIDTAELVAITHHLLEAGASEAQIRKVMGGNMLSFLRRNLPD